MKRQSAYQKLKQKLLESEERSDRIDGEISRYIHGEMSEFDKMLFEYRYRVYRNMENALWFGSTATIGYGIKTDENGK